MHWYAKNYLFSEGWYYLLCNKLLDLVLTDLRIFSPYNECNGDITGKFIFHSATDPK